jgi:phosphoglucomutase
MINQHVNLIIDRAKQWAANDPNELTTRYVESLVSLLLTDDESSLAAAEALVKVTKMFPLKDSERIEFGTAGLRSSMEPGPFHMNDLVVIQAAQGIARYCQEVFISSSGAPATGHTNTTTNLGVVVGYDHRANSMFNLSSLSFAILTMLVFKEAGFHDCFLYNGLIATPFVPFAVNYLNKQIKKVDTTINNVYIGIMITASHNPKNDAGYKVYWNDGCQIRSPIDSGMSRHILKNLHPWIDYGSAIESRRRKYPDDPCLGLSSTERTNQIMDSYYTAIEQSGLVQLQTQNAPPGSSSISLPKFCYTAMHGVGYQYAKRAYDDIFKLGIPFVSVPDQQEPNPDFPTVPFPNPEEKGALDLAKQYATQNNCDIILANDPDADRLAVAEKCRTTNEWTVFHGDQIGVLLGHWLWENIGRNRQITSGRQIAMCASTASSKMLAKIAEVEGFHFEDTLTGFKWIGAKAAQLHSSGMYETLFCYEEAIGFCCGNVVFDKDGITALGVFAQLANDVYMNPSLGSAKHYLQSLYDKYGEFVSNNGYYLVDDPTITKMIFDKLSSNNDLHTMKVVGPYTISSIRYLGVPGYDSTTPNNVPTLPVSASSPMLTINFTNGCCAQFRGSGTEPKFKYYFELRGSPGTARTVVANELLSMSKTLLDILIEPTKNGLRAPG